MNILLVRPPDITKKNFYCTPYMGLGYLATALRKKGHEIKILQCVKEKMDLARFEKYLKNNEGKFDLIGFTSETYDVYSTIKSLEVVKRNFPQIYVIVGGPHVSAAPEMAVYNDFINADYLIKGEGEISFPKLIDFLNGNSILREDIPGLIWRDNGKVIFNDTIIHANIDDFGIPAWDLMNPIEYEPSPFNGFARRWPLAPMIATRGCPFQCTFCSSKFQMGRGLRKRSIELVIEEMKLLIGKYGIREIQFVDDCITVDRQYIRGLCEAIIKDNIQILWQCPNGIRIDTMDEEILRLMRRAGCYHVSVGIESASPESIKRMKKGISLDLVREKVTLAKKIGIKVTGFFILGFPGEKKRDIINTINFSRKLPLDRVNYSNFWPSPGTEIYEELKREGKMNKDNIGTHYFKATFPPEDMTPEQLKRWQIWGIISFYMRPRILRSMFEDITSWRQAGNLMKKFIALLTMK